MRTHPPESEPCLRGSPTRRTAGAHTVSRRCSSVCHPPECARNGHSGQIYAHSRWPSDYEKATCNLPPDNMEDCDNETTDAASSTTHNAGMSTETADASTLLADPPAEFFIGIQDDDAHDPVDLMIVFQKNLELVQEAGKNLHKLEQRRRCSTDADTKTEAASALAAEKKQAGNSTCRFAETCK